jgi:putative FmdB family regulatory protein
MPLYDYACDECGDTAERFFGMKEMPHSIPCPCGASMVRVFNAGNAPNLDVEHVRYSLALGMSPEQIASGEAARVHPGAEFDSRGLMKIHNRTEKLKRIRERGLIEMD